MAKGKFESAPLRGSGSAQSYGTKRKRRRSKQKRWPILVAAIGALVVLAGVALLLLNASGKLQLFGKADRDDNGLIADRVIAAGVDLSGMNKEEAMAALEAAVSVYDTDMHFTVSQQTEDGEEPAHEPVELVFTAAETGVTLDPEKAYQEAYRVGRELGSPAEGEQFIVDAERYLSLDRDVIRSRVKEAAEALDAGQALVQTKVTTFTERREVEVEQEDGTVKKEKKDVDMLRFILGTSGVDFSSEDLYNAILRAYGKANFNDELLFERTAPKKLDIDKLEEICCTPPVDAVYDKTTHEIKDEIPGYGFDREELLKLLEETPEGEQFTMELKAIEPDVTAEDLRASLFSDVLATVSTPHTGYWNRTRNLELACDAINGTVVLPGETFSFNETVGVRTEAKGYLPATAYVSGGASAEEIGGGVCQVASSIYYATLLADLKAVERYPHMYAVTYVPMGMDAAIYWGSQDFKFENNTDYPLRIDAVCSGGYVNIQLVGTDERDYKVEMTFEILETIPWEEIEVETNDVEPGTVITTAYTGYRVATYMHKIDKTTGEELSVERVATSYYAKRDREVAVPIGGYVPEESTLPDDGAGFSESDLPGEDDFVYPSGDPSESTDPAALPPGDGGDSGDGNSGDGGGSGDGGYGGFTWP